MPQESTITYKTRMAGTEDGDQDLANSQLLSGECETLPNGQTSGKFYTYLSYTGFSSQNATPLNPNANLTDLPTDVAEYDYGAVSSSYTKPSSTPMRETKTTYESFGTTPLSPDASIGSSRHRSGIRQRTLLSETDYAYDGGAPPTGVGNVAPTTVSSVYGHERRITAMV